MQEARPTTEPRNYCDIENDYLPSIATIQGITDLLSEATKDKRERLDSLAEGTMFALADRCWQEACTVKNLFDELLDLHIAEVRRREVLEKELNAKPQESKIETEAKTLNHLLAVAQNIVGNISDEVDSIDGKVGVQS